jgi:hypothetical protein
VTLEYEMQYSRRSPGAIYLGTASLETLAWSRDHVLLLEAALAAIQEEFSGELLNSHAMYSICHLFERLVFVATGESARATPMVEEFVEVSAGYRPW